MCIQQQKIRRFTTLYLQIPGSHHPQPLLIHHILRTIFTGDIPIIPPIGGSVINHKNIHFPIRMLPDTPKGIFQLLPFVKKRNNYG